MRALLVLLAVLVAAPTASAARLIVEQGEDTPFRFGDAGLAQGSRVVDVGKEPTSMVRSPDGRRVAVLDYASRQIRIFDRGGELLRTLANERGSELFWPTRSHIVVDEFDAVASYDLVKGTVRRARFRPREVTGAERVGKRVRVVLRNALGGGAIAVVDVGAAGRVRARRTVKPPAGFADPDETIGTSLSGDLLLLSDRDSHALVRIGGTTKAIDLPGDYYGWAGRDLLEDFDGNVARVDRGSRTVVRSVDTGIDDAAAIPYRGGFIIGFGRRRYDAGFRLVAENAHPVKVQDAPEPLLFDGRLYARLPNCGVDDPIGGIAIADAATGKPVKTLKGYYAFGVFGSGRVFYSEYDDDCD